MLPALQKPFGRTGSEAQEDSTEEMQAMWLQSVERVLQTLGLHQLFHFAAVKENRSLACACYPTYKVKSI